MKISEVRIVPVAEVCDRRRTDPKNPSGCSTIAAFVRKPQIEPVTPTPANQAQSSLIKPNQTISCLDAIHSQPPWGLWFGVWCLICASTRSNPGLRFVRIGRPVCRPPTPIKSAFRNPQFQSAPVKASQSQSKRFPIVTFVPRSQPRPRYMVVSPAKCTTNCGLPIQPTPIRPCNPHFPSNPDRSARSARFDRSDRS